MTKHQRLGSLVLLLVAILTAWLLLQRRNMDETTVPSTDTRSAPKPVYVSKRQRSYCVNENWSSSDFFSAPEMLSAAEIISSGDHDELKKLTESGFDLDRTGKHGVTLLFWAFFNLDIESFKILLNAGASPDKRLTETIPIKDGYSAPNKFYAGDTVLFISLIQARWHFLNAAVPKTEDINQRRINGDNLLLVAFGVRKVGSIYADSVKLIVDAGFDVNSRATGKIKISVLTQADSADRLFGKPHFSVMLLKQGADPCILDSSNGRSFKENAMDSWRRTLEGWRKDRFRPVVDETEFLMELRQLLDQHDCE